MVVDWWYGGGGVIEVGVVVVVIRWCGSGAMVMWSGVVVW